MTDSDSQEGSASVKSARRVLSIFEYFEKYRVPRTLSEISQDLGYPVSSALALLRSIQSMGYVTYNTDSKCYFPSIRFAMLAQWITEGHMELGSLVQMMENLAAASRETVLLGMQNGLFAQQIHIVETTQSLGYRPPNGTLRPLLRSVVGRALLSQQSEAQIRKVVEWSNGTESIAAQKFDPATVLSELAQVKRDGYVYAQSVFTPGVSNVAVALPVRKGNPPMVVTVAGPSSRINREAIPTLLKHIHAAIEAMQASEAAARA